MNAKQRFWHVGVAIEKLIGARNQHLTSIVVSLVVEGKLFQANSPCSGGSCGLLAVEIVEIGDFTDVGWALLPANGG